MLTRAPLAVLNHLLAGADWARARLQAYSGRRCTLSAPPLQLHLCIDAAGYFSLADATGTAADVSITLPPLRPWQLPQALQDPQALMAQAHITGQADLAETLGFVLRNLRWDYEQDLSRVVGDIAAQRLGQGLRALGHWSQDARVRLNENLAEYLGTETTLLARPDELAQHAAQLDQLTNTLDALEQRLERLA